MVAKLHAYPSCCFQACIRQQSGQDDPLFAIALQLVVEVGVRETTGSPVFRCNHIARLHLEIVMEGAASGVFSESLPFGCT